MKIKALIIISLFSIKVFSQKGNISGVVVDNFRNPIPFATVHIKNIDKVIYTNDQGFFSTPKLYYKSYVIEYSSLGYQK